MRRPPTDLSQSLCRVLGITALGMTASLTPLKLSQAAETIYFDYGPVGRSVPVSSLEAFVETGAVADDLAPYLNLMTPEAQAEFRRVLGTPLPEVNVEVPSKLYSPWVISQWLQSPIGEQVLSKLGQVIQTRSRQNGQQAIRAAMVLAASRSEGLSLINVIRDFPTAGMRIDLERVLAISDTIQEVAALTDLVVDEVTAASLAQASEDPDIDNNSLPNLSNTAKFSVVQQSLTLVDPTRDRTYPADLYYPHNFDTIEGPIPVMVLAHGYADTRENLYIVNAAQRLAANGFLVAVPDLLAVIKPISRPQRPVLGVKLWTRLTSSIAPLMSASYLTN